MVHQVYGAMIGTCKENNNILCAQFFFLCMSPSGLRTNASRPFAPEPLFEQNEDKRSIKM